MNEPVEQEKAEKLKRSNWWWPGVVASSLAGAAVLVFRGCWHGQMSLPIFGQGYSYHGFLSCGAKRLVNESTLNAYGPFLYDLNEISAWGKSAETNAHPLNDS